MLAAVAAVVVATVLLVYLPQARKLRSLRTQITSQERSLVADSEKASIVPQLLQEVEVMKSRYKDFGRRLPERQELGGFLKEISSRLAAANLSGQLIEPGNPSQAELFHTLPIIMRFRGSYLSVAGFLHSLDEMERLTRVQKLQMTLDEQSRETGDLGIDMQINIYFTES
jgi:Tfp pilus assembly protein PilO